MIVSSEQGKKIPGTMVKQSTHKLNVEGSDPAAASVAPGEANVKKLRMPTDYIF